MLNSVYFKILKKMEQSIFIYNVQKKKVFETLKYFFKEIKIC